MIILRSGRGVSGLRSEDRYVESTGQSSICLAKDTTYHPILPQLIPTTGRVMQVFEPFIYNSFKFLMFLIKILVQSFPRTIAAPYPRNRWRCTVRLFLDNLNGWNMHFSISRGFQEISIPLRASLLLPNHSLVPLIVRNGERESDPSCQGG